MCIYTQMEVSALKYKTIHKSNCYCISLCRASNAVLDYYDRKFAEKNITTKQFSLLINLSRMEEANVAELAEYVNLERSTVTRNLKLLLARGWVCDLAKKNSRGHRYALTTAGEEQLHACLPIWDACQNEIRDFLGEENVQLFTQLLYHLQTLQKEES